jgi:Na+-transporting NADH:ubiquinone oxidoreductase subunit NqrA
VDGISHAAVQQIPVPGSVPAAIFVTAIDTNPLSADPQPLIFAQRKAFDAGLTLLTRLTAGKVHVCQAWGNLAAIRKGRSPLTNLPARIRQALPERTFIFLNPSA